MNTMKLLLVLSAVLLASCRTMTDNQVAAEALAVTQSVNGSDIDALNASSGTPFLFETEIFPSPVQLNALWEGLAASGYDFGPKGEITVSDPDENTWKKFSSSREVQVWFQSHAPENAALAVIPTGDGKILLVIDRDRRHSDRIRGLKVDQS
ncbi:MAG: hypothetical protein P1P77_16395 [Spirochaetaceae bacterium]|nr:hypothetical protein [Spirochaetaceae bacterium]